jgi:hypothetical protein
MSAQFPNVPDAPGVPQVARNATNSAAPVAVTPLTGDSAASTGGTSQTWGIYTTSNNPAVVSDSTVEIEFNKEARISNYPDETGAFQSYNKTQRNYEAVVVMTRGGSISDRTTFLNGLESVQADTNLYNVVMPEKTYVNANITRYGLRRRAEGGASLITAEVHLEEVRVTASMAFSTVAIVQDPSAAAQNDSGAVQATTPTTAQSAAAGPVQ